MLATIPSSGYLIAVVLQNLHLTANPPEASPSGKEMDQRDNTDLQSSTISMLTNNEEPKEA